MLHVLCVGVTAFYFIFSEGVRKRRLLLGQLYFLLQLQLGFVITFWNGDGSYADKRLVFKYSGN